MRKANVSRQLFLTMATLWQFNIFFFWNKIKTTTNIHADPTTTLMEVIYM